MLSRIIDGGLFRDKIGTRKGIVQASLEGAFEEPGCPMCRLLLKQEERWLTVILAESVVDLGIRRRIGASWGFCRRHAWAMAARTDLGGPLATAIIYESLASLLLQHCQVSLQARNGSNHIAMGHPGNLDAAVPGHGCPACAARAGIERNYVNSFIRYCRVDSFVRRYQESDGLCLAHLDQVLALAGPRERDMLLADKAAKLETSLQAPVVSSPPPQYMMAAPPEVGHRLGLLMGPPPFFPGSLDHVRYVQPWAREWKMTDGRDEACRACTLEREAEQQQLETLLAPDAAKNGDVLWLCSDHAWKLYALSLRRLRQASIDQWSRRWAQAAAGELRLLVSGAGSSAHTWALLPRNRHSPRPTAEIIHSCSICAAQARIVDGWIAQELSLLAQKPESEATLAEVCLPHAQALLRKAPPEAAGTVRRRQLARLQGLQEELALYIHKVNWDHRDEAWGPERDSWWRIVRFFVGDE